MSEGQKSQISIDSVDILRGVKAAKNDEEALDYIESELQIFVETLSRRAKKMLSDAGLKMKEVSQAFLKVRQERDDALTKLEECERVARRQNAAIGGFQVVIKETSEELDATVREVKGLRKGMKTLQAKESKYQESISREQDRSASLEKEVRRLKAKIEDIRQALEKEEDTEGINCKVCGSEAKSRCSKCKKARYCSRACRDKDTIHKTLFCISS